MNWQECRRGFYVPKHKVFIGCDATSAIHTPTMSAHLPVTPDHFAADAITVAEAGAAISHLHALDPNNGNPTHDPNVFEQLG